MRDFAPIRQTFFKFDREDNYGTAQQQKFKNLIAKCTKQRFFYDSALVIDGGNIMHNDIDTALSTQRIFKKNSIFTKKEIIGQLRHELNLNNVVIIPEVSGEPSGHADLTLSFIEKDVVVYTDLAGTGEIRRVLEEKLPKVTLVELKAHVLRESLELYNTACGLYVNILSTDRYLYVPVFGSDKENQKRGQTVQRDMAALTQVAKHSKKTVVPIPIPYKVCVLGGNTRCLAWHEDAGGVADDIMEAARRGRCED